MVTVKDRVAVLLPSAVVTVMVAVPGFLAVMTPLASIVAMEVSLEVQVTFLLAALDGVTLAVTVSLPPSIIERAVLLMDTPVTDVDSVDGGVGELGMPLDPPESPPHEAMLTQSIANNNLVVSFMVLHICRFWPPLSKHTKTKKRGSLYLLLVPYFKAFALPSPTERATQKPTLKYDYNT